MISTRWSLLAISLLLSACGATTSSSPLLRSQASGPDGVGPTYRVLAVGPLAVTSLAVDSAVAGSPKEAATDGNQATAWMNGGYRNATSWLVAGLGAGATLTSVNIKTPPVVGTRFDIQVSADGTLWRTAIASATTTTWGLEAKTLPAGTTGRYVRVLWYNNAAAPQPHFSIFELSITGTPGTSATPAPTPAPTSSPRPSPTPTPVTGGSGGYPSAAVAAPAYAAHPSFLGTGLRGPNGLARTADDTMYESDWEGNTITRITQAGVSTRYAGGFNGPAGLAFDLAGNLLVAGYNSHTLEKVTPGGAAKQIVVGRGLNRPVWPAVNKQGVIYLADYSNNRIARILPDGTVSTFLNISGVNAIDLDPQGNLWITTWGGRVAKVTPAGVLTAVPVTGLYSACGIAWNPSYLAVVTYGGQTQRNGRLVLVDFAGKVYPVASGLDRASSVIFDSKGAVYAANVGDRALRKYALR